MPNRKSNTTRKTTYKKKYRKYNKMSNSTLYQGPQPKSQIVHMRYCAYKTLVPQGASAVYANFRANGLYDPDCAAGGNQPLGRDQWAVFYDHYVVLGARMMVNFQCLNDPTSLYMPNICGVMLNDDEYQIVASWVDLAEQGRCKYITVQGTGASTGPHVVTLGYSAKKQYHTKNPQLMDSITAQVEADPLDQTIFTIFCASADQASATTGVRCTISIDYLVKYYEPKEIGRS